MKTNLFTLMIALITASSYAGIGLGVKGGLSLFRSEDNQSFNFFNDYNIGPDISAFCELGSGKFIRHNIQFSFYRAGGKNFSTATDALGRDIGESIDKLMLDYIGLGYDLKFKFPLPIIKPYTAVGVSFDYLIKIKSEWEINGHTSEFQAFKYSELNKFNIRPFVTAGLEYKISIITILMDYTFSYNTIPFYEHEKTGDYLGIKYKTFGHLINVGCKLEL